MSPGRGQRWVLALSLAAVLATLALVVLGGVVRVTGSGLGCPDWPLCHGRVLPPWELTAIIEYTHRLVASAVVSPLVLATAGLVWWTRRREPWLMVTASLAVVLLAGQALLGGVTVLRELPPATVAAHLSLGQALLGCLVVLAVAARRGPPEIAARPGTPGRLPAGEMPDRFPRLALAAAGALYLLLLTGAYVTASGAIAACPSWPLCDGTSLLGGAAGRLSHVHMLHRLAALVVGLFVLYVLHRGMRRRGPLATRLLSAAATSLLAAQVLVGALMIWQGFPVGLMALHLALASATWAAVVAVAALNLPGRQAARLGQAPQMGPAHA